MSPQEIALRQQRVFSLAAQLFTSEEYTNAAIARPLLWEFAIEEAAARVSVFEQLCRKYTAETGPRANNQGEQNHGKSS